MKWKIPFNVFSKKAATEVQKLVVRMLGLEPQWTPRDYENFAKEGYNANVWVYRCIKAIAENAASVPFLLYSSSSKEKEIEKHPLLDLLNKPNELTSKNELIESYVAFALISGNSYLDMNGPTVGPPRELWVLRPDRMKIVPSAQDFIRGYEYSTTAGKILIEKQDKRISHLKYFNPIDDLYGLAPVEVAARGIDNDNAANTWNNSLLNNGARPGGALVTDETLTEKQYDNLKSEIDTNYKGAKNAGKPMLLEGGLKWQEMSLNPKDMEFISAKKMSIVEICAAFGVPPEIVGYGENKTYSNYAEARRALYEDGVVPMLNKIKDKLNADLVPKFGGNLYLDFDLSNIEALQENRDAVYTRAENAYKNGLLKLNEARFEIGYSEVPEGDAFYQPPTPGIMDPQPTDGEKNKGFFLNIKAFNLTSDEQKTMFWKSMDRRRATYEKRMIKKVQERFKAEQKAVLDEYEASGEKGIEKAVKDGKKAWMKLYAELYVEVMQDFGNQLFNQLKSEAINLEIKADPIPIDETFDVYDELVQQFIAETVALKVVAVTDTTILKIKALVSLGMENGESIIQIKKRIDELYLDQIIPNRSTVIARTEVIGASNAGNRHAALQTGLKLEKEWIATRDDRTRESHEDLDGQTRKMDEPYKNGLLFPGDPTGGAKEVIQCRCSEGYSVIK